MTTKKTTTRRTTKPKAPKAETVTLRGLISTTSLRAGETTTVTRTPHVDDLIAGGYVEIIE